MQITEHQLVDGATLIDLPKLPVPATVTVWRVPTEYRANSLFIATTKASDAEEVPACDHGEPVFKGPLPAHEQTVLIAQIKALEAASSQAVQTMLDAEARTHNYDGILSASTYATSTNPRFQAEGQACVEWRDAVWAKCYTVMSQVQAGTLPQPTVDELLAMLPAMTWPA